MKLTANIGVMVGMALFSQTASAIFVSQNLFDPKAPRPLNERIYDTGGLALRDSVGYLSANVTLEGGDMASLIARRPRLENGWFSPRHIVLMAKATATAPLIRPAAQRSRFTAMAPR